jgi:uncharacterized protein (DUF1697 family)
MSRHVALLRGINVGGHNRLPMATLRAVAESVGCTDVATYVQSGNLVVTSASDGGTLSTSLHEALAGETGLSISVITRTAAQWTTIVAENPYPTETIGSTILHVTCLAGPAGLAFDAIERARFLPDAFSLSAGETELYLSLPGGMGNSKLAVAIERAAAKRPGTTRNWKTVLEIDRLLAG